MENQNTLTTAAAAPTTDKPNVELKVWLNQKLGRKIKNGAPLMRRDCNICSRSYMTGDRFSRFCRSCRVGSEVYRLAEWLPTSRLSA